MRKSNLPPRWAQARIGDVVEDRVIQGLPYDKHEFTYIDISAVNNRLKEIVEPKELLIADAPSRARQQVKSGDVLVSTTRPNLNAVALVPPRLDGAIASTGFAVLRPILLEPRWLYSVVQSEEFITEMTALVRGALYPAIRPRNVHDYVMSIPPLAEQKRITRKLDELLRRVRSVAITLGTLPELIQQYRVAVLEAACTGRLVPTEAELTLTHHYDFEPASILLERIVAERRAEWERQELARMEVGKRTPKDHAWKERYKEPKPLVNIPKRLLPTGWTWAKINQCGAVQLGRQRSPEHHKGENLRPYLRVANVFEDRIDLKDVKQMNFTPEEYEVFRLELNDILLNEGQTLDLIGRPAMYRGEVKGACFQNTLIRFRSLPGLLPEYALAVFRYYFHSKRFREIGKIVTNLAHLGMGRFAELEFPLPPLAEQKRIVEKLALYLSAIHNIESQVAASLSQAAELRVSLFEQALSGVLVAQSHKDEPAEELMTRIVAAKEEMATKQEASKPKRRMTKQKLNQTLSVAEKLRSVIETHFGENSFTFTELNSHLTIDYESIKVEIFNWLVAKRGWRLKQVFNSTNAQMELQQVGL